MHKGWREKFNLVVKKLGELKSEIAHSDIMIVATGAKDITLEASMIPKDKPLLILDLSVPSNVDPQINDLDNVTLINLDELSQLTNNNLKKEKKFIPQANQILNEVKAEFFQWVDHRKYAPTLKALKQNYLTVNSKSRGMQRNFLKSFID